VWHYFRTKELEQYNMYILMEHTDIKTCTYLSQRYLTQTFSIRQFYPLKLLQLFHCKCWVTVIALTSSI